MRLKSDQSRHVPVLAGGGYDVRDNRDVHAQWHGNTCHRLHGFGRVEVASVTVTFPAGSTTVDRV